MTNFEFLLRILDCDVLVRCSDEESSRLLREGYSAFLCDAGPGSPPAISYQISPAHDAKDGHSRGWTMQCEEQSMHCRDRYCLVYEFEKDMTVRLQLLRPELFFVHAAALSAGERCVLVSGESGIGKSSLAWYMSHNGFEYLSDELAPIDPVSLQVEAYPHALCLKNEPLTAPALPDSAFYTEATIHVPAYELPTRALLRPCPLELLVFVVASVHGKDLLVRTIGAAESAAQLYSNGLNQLAHRNDGLATAARVSKGVSSYVIGGGTVEERGRAIRDLLFAT